MLKGFRDFIARGSVIDLAVGIVIGAAFTSLVNSFVTNVINPIIGLFGTKSLNAYLWCIKPADGKTTCVIDDSITALVVYFVFVLPMNKYRARHASEEEEAEAAEITLLREIRDSLQSR